MENLLKNSIEVIKTGCPQEVKEAQKKIEKFWHEVYIPHRKEGKRAFAIFLEEIKRFEEIKDIEHQAYFINTLKWPLWSIGAEYFNEWAEFILKYIQHPSGKIRQAIIKAADYLIMDIIADLKVDSQKEISREEKERIERIKNQFCQLVEAVENLLEKYDEPKFRRYKYISSLPPSIYKSLQKLLVEVLLHNEYYENLYYQYIASKIEIPKSVEENLERLLEKYKLSGKLSVEVIKDWAWNDLRKSAMDASHRFQKKIFSYFKNIKDIDELNEILQVFNDAWNYFPHFSLGGKSPNQLVKEALGKPPNLRKQKSEKMPDFIVGGKRISWDDYWAMMKEMEELQKPFRKWVEESVLPEYRDYLTNEEKLPSEIVENSFRVAEVFFERAMQVGFVDFNQIRPEFAKCEFPRWWQTHVLGIDLNENEIWSSLKNLFKFLTIKYKINTERFFNL